MKETTRRGGGHSICGKKLTSTRIDGKGPIKKKKNGFHTIIKREMRRTIIQQRGGESPCPRGEDQRKEGKEFLTWPGKRKSTGYAAKKSFLLKGGSGKGEIKRLV